MKTPLLAGALLAAIAIAPEAQRVGPTVADNAVITVDGRSFSTWQDYLGSDLFLEQGLRCGAPERDPNRFPMLESVLPGSASDCTYNSTNPSEDYAPAFVVEIPVVVHVIQRTNGTGFVSEARVRAQIDVLNEDFRAAVGTNGEPGTDTAIQFVLATEDPNGAPTNGITYSTNDTWFNDGGGYWNSLAWDTSRYMNVYSNSASGALGYVPDLPQGGIAGSNADRVVVLHSTVGRNAPIGPPFNLGRTLTHEVGHYLGLEHTFSGGCGSASACYTSGDLVCDTSRESSPTNGCPGNKVTCGTPDPIHNYMDYSSDSCMWEFTPEQTRRMRCSLQHYRSQLGTVLAVDRLVNSVGILSSVAGGTLDFSLDVGPQPAATFYWLLGSLSGTQPGIDVGNGNLLPLNFDAYMQLTFDPGNSVFRDIVGYFDASGRATASLIVPPGLGPDFAGVTLHHAFFAGTTPGVVDFVSNPTALLLQ